MGRLLADVRQVHPGDVFQGRIKGTQIREEEKPFAVVDELGIDPAVGGRVAHVLVVPLIQTEDPLTRLLNRRGLEDALQISLANASRQNLHTAAIMLDIDHPRWMPSLKRLQKASADMAEAEKKTGLAKMVGKAWAGARAGLAFVSILTIPSIKVDVPEDTRMVPAY